MPLLLADGFISFLVYLAIAVVWGIGQFVQQKEAKRKAEEFKRKREEQARTSPPPPPRAAPSPKTLEAELQEFLGRIAGESTPVAPPPPPKPVIVFDPPKPAPPPLPKAVLPPAAIPSHMQRQADQISDLNTEDVYKTVDELRDIEEMDMDLSAVGSISNTALATVRTLMVDMSLTNVPMPRLPMRNNRAVLTKTTKPKLSDRHVLKRTLVGNLLLGSPKALQKDPFQAEQGGV
jgi:hypothetical protein